MDKRTARLKGKVVFVSGLWTVEGRAVVVAGGTRRKPQARESHARVRLCGRKAKKVSRLYTTDRGGVRAIPTYNHLFMHDEVPCLFVDQAHTEASLVVIGGRSESVALRGRACV